MKKIILPLLIIISLAFTVSASAIDALNATENSQGQYYSDIHDDEMKIIDPLPEGAVRIVEYDGGQLTFYHEVDDETLAELIKFAIEHPINPEKSIVAEAASDVPQVHQCGDIFFIDQRIEHDTVTNDSAKCGEYKATVYYCSFHSNCYIWGVWQKVRNCPENHPYEVR